MAIRDGGDGAKQQRIKRLAIQLAGQLPEDISEARLVIGQLYVLLNEFLENSEENETERLPQLVIVPKTAE